MLFPHLDERQRRLVAGQRLGVSAVSGSNAWAVGSYTDTSGLASKTLILHWNGTAWANV